MNKILIAGATGVIGHQLVPQLETAGYEVAGMARHKHGHMGAHTITVDALDLTCTSDC